MAPKTKTVFQKVDKENPASWKKYTEKSCLNCVGTCCTMPIEIRWEDMVRLELVDGEDLETPLQTIITRLKKQKVITAYREDSGLFALKQTADGKCRYLINNRCSFYEKRPLVCRRFPLRAGWRHGYCPQTPITNSPQKKK